MHRSILDHWTNQEKRKFSKFEAWIDILLMVNHEDKKVVLGNEVVLVKRGQRITSVRQLCERWDWSNSKVNSFLKLLENDGMVTVKSDTKKTVLTVDKYDFYQCSKEEETTQKRHVNDAKATRINTNNNDNNENNENKKEDKEASVWLEEVHDNVLPFTSQPETYKEIITYLNDKTDSKYKHTTPKTQTLIKARLNEGFTLEDFKKVIDVKTDEWLKDSKMYKFLRPDTLFGTKFEAYLNEFGKTPKGDSYDWNRKGNQPPADEFDELSF